MTRAQNWRGSPKATTKQEFFRLLRVLHLSKNKDVFFDVGCGYALPCIWIADRVRLAIGIENFSPRFRRAETNVRKSRRENIKLEKKSFQDVPFNDATIIHCVILLGISEYRKINFECSPNTIVALCYPPMYPFKSIKKGGYYILKTPFERVSDEKEYARAVMNRKDASMKDVLKSLNYGAAKSLRWQISHANYVWKSLRKQSID